MLGVRSIAVLGALAAMISLPARALAWTDAAVRSVSAEVVIDAEARAQVRLVVSVRVDAGWLEGFEIAGLDPDLVLDEAAPPIFRDSSGAEIRMRAEDAGEGRITMAFRRRDAPRRGDYVAEVRYTTALAHRATEALGDRIRVHWTLPGWRSGLDSPSVTLDVPEGTTLLAREEESPGLEVQHLPSPHGGERFVLRRVHLPRTREWPIVLEVPAERMSPTLRQLPGARSETAGAEGAGEPTSPQSAEAEGAAHDSSPLSSSGLSSSGQSFSGQSFSGQSFSPLSSSPLSHALLALVVACLLALRAFSIERAEIACRVPCAAWVPLGARTRLAAVGSLGAAASIAALVLSPLASLALLALATLLVLRRRADAPRAARLGTFRASDALLHRSARRARWTSALDPSDASTLPGALVLASAIAAPIALETRGELPLPLAHALAAAGLVALAMLRGTRGSRPSSPLEDLAALLDWSSRQRSVAEEGRSWALRPMVHAGVRGEIQDARVRVVLASMPKGLLRLDVVRGLSSSRDAWTGAPLLVVVTRTESPADRALGEALPSAPRLDAPRRRARIVALDEGLAAALAPVLDALAHVPSEQAREAISHPDLLAAS